MTPSLLAVVNAALDGAFVAQARNTVVRNVKLALATVMAMVMIMAPKSTRRKDVVLNITITSVPRSNAALLLAIVVVAETTAVFQRIARMVSAGVTLKSSQLAQSPTETTEI